MEQGGAIDLPEQVGRQLLVRGAQRLDIRVTGDWHTGQLLCAQQDIPAV